MWVLTAILVGQVAAVIYAVLLLDAAKSLRQTDRLDNPQRLARRLACGALAMFFVAAAFAFGLGFAVNQDQPKKLSELQRMRQLQGIEEKHDDSEQVLPLLWGGINAALAVAAAFVLLQASKSLHVGGERAGERPSERVAGWLNLVGWVILLFPVVLLALALVVAVLAFSWWALVLVALIGISSTLIIAGKRKADQSAVLWALAVATERNLPLADELIAVAGGLSRKHAQRIRRLTELLRGGTPLTLALEQTPRVIPRFALLAAHVGEENGTLPAALRDAAIRQTRSAESSSSNVSSPTMVIAYLLLMPLFCALTLGFLMYFIVPKYRKIFQGFQTELPEVTKTLLITSDFVVTQPLILFPLLFVPAAVVFVAAVAHLRGWGEFDPPLFGRLLRRLDVPNLLRNLALTIAGDRPLREAMEVMAVRHPRKAVRRALAEALIAVQKGDDCWHSLKDAGLLSPNETAVLRSAQRLGNVPWALNVLADGMERRRSHRWGAILEFAQPAVVIGIGLCSAAIFFAFFMPLLKLIGGIA